MHLNPSMIEKFFLLQYTVQYFAKKKVNKYNNKKKEAGRRQGGGQHLLSG